MKLQLLRVLGVCSIWVAVLLAGMFGAGECRGELWTSPDDRLSLDFPVKPEENRFKTPVGDFADFRATEHTGTDFINYGITIVDTHYKPSKVIRSDAQQLIAMTHEQFVKTLKGDESTIQSEHSTFADGIDRLNYQFDFNRKGEKCTCLGFWFMDQNRIVRISVIYPVAAKMACHDAAEKFINSFKIIGEVYIPDDLESYVKKVVSSASLQPGKCTDKLINSMNVGVVQAGGTPVGAWCFFSGEGLDTVRMSVEKAQIKNGPLFWRDEWLTLTPKGFRCTEKVGVLGSGLTWFVVPAMDAYAADPSDAKTLVIAHGMK